VDYTPDYLFDLAELEKPYWRGRLGTVLVKITCFVKQYFFMLKAATLFITRSIVLNLPLQ